MALSFYHIAASTAIQKIYADFMQNVHECEKRLRAEALYCFYSVEIVTAPAGFAMTLEKG